MNRLGSETSPYLLQHAANPVHWWPWADEALAEARRTNRPILLSVGYAACHWCHVMAHESFESPEVAAAMNELFVNIKVDREERPDVDSIYMQALQIMGDQGGVSEKTQDDMRASGLGHVLSISGLHMALVAGSIVPAARRLRPPLPPHGSSRSPSPPAPRPAPGRPL